MLRQYRAIPQCGGDAEVPGGLPQIALQFAPLTGIKRRGAAWAFALTQRLETALLKAAHPTLHRRTILTK
jgi:hypothetical protein